MGAKYQDLCDGSVGQGLARDHIRLEVAARPRGLAQVALAFAEHNVSVETVRHQPLSPDPEHPDQGRASLVVVTHTASDAALSATVGALAALSAGRGVTSVMRRGGE